MRWLTNCVVFAFASAPVHADSLTTAKVVRANTILAAADIAVSEQDAPGALSDLAHVVGLEARITLYPGRPIMPEHVGPITLVNRNQLVTLTYKHGGLTISTDGRALSRGGLGDMVRVMNLASRATVAGQVLDAATVHVSAGGPRN